MTKQNNALRLAELLTADEWPGHMTLVSYARECAAELRRQYAELESLRAKIKTYEDLGGAADDVQLLRMGYAAARLEIESLRGRGWVNLPGQLPEPGKPVLLDIGKSTPSGPCGLRSTRSKLTTKLTPTGASTTKPPTCSTAPRAGTSGTSTKKCTGQ